MDEMQKIHKQLAALAQAQAALLKQRPPDIPGFQNLTSLISDLQFRMLALSSQPQIPPLTAAEISALESAVASLEASVRASAGASGLLVAATAVANS